MSLSPSSTPPLALSVAPSALFPSRSISLPAPARTVSAARHRRGTVSQREEGLTYTEPADLTILETSGSRWLISALSCAPETPTFYAVVNGELAVLQGGKALTWFYKGCASILLTHECTAMCVSENGQWAVAGTDQGRIMIWQLSSMNLVCECQVGSAIKPVPVTLVSISENGSTLVIRARDGFPTVYRTLPGQGATSLKLERLCVLNCTEVSDKVPFRANFCAGPSDGSVVILYHTGEQAGVAALYTLPDESPENQIGESAPVFNAKGLLNGHSMSVLSCSIAAVALTGGRDGRAASYRLDNYRVTAFFSHPTSTQVPHVLMIPGGRFVVTAASDGCVRVWGAHPWFPRSERGYAPLLARLDPPSSILGKSARIVHLGFDLTRIHVAWMCDEPKDPTAADSELNGRLLWVLYPSLPALCRAARSEVALMISRCIKEKMGEDLQLRRRVLGFVF